MPLRHSHAQGLVWGMLCIKGRHVHVGDEGKYRDLVGVHEVKRQDHKVLSAPDPQRPPYTCSSPLTLKDTVWLFVVMVCWNRAWGSCAIATDTLPCGCRTAGAAGTGSLDEARMRLRQSCFTEQELPQRLIKYKLQNACVPVSQGHHKPQPAQQACTTHVACRERRGNCDPGAMSKASPHSLAHIGHPQQTHCLNLQA